MIHGALSNPKNRFDIRHLSYEPGREPRTVPLRLFRDSSRAALSRNDSPDVPFDVSLNPYRGCEHGCAYCYARPTHEFLGFSAGLDFETKIVVKEDAPELLRQTLARPSWQPQVIALSGVTDAYQPIERRLLLTRRCLEVFAEFLNPVGIVTKNELVTRDLDLLGELAAVEAVSVSLSITTLDQRLAARMEPRASSPKGRLRAIRKLRQAGIPVGVGVSPVIPGLTDHEIPRILEAARDAGAQFASFITVRLPYNLKEQFELWLREHFPQRAERVLERIRDIRGGKLNSAEFGERMRGSGLYAGQMRSLFETQAQKLGLRRSGPKLSTQAFRRPPSPQLALF